MYINLEMESLAIISHLGKLGCRKEGDNCYLIRKNILVSLKSHKVDIIEISLELLM